MHKWSSYTLSIIVIVLACVVRLPHLNGSFWLDEAAQMLESTRPLSQQLSIAKDFQPPLFHILIFCAAQFSQAEWFVRFIGAYIPGIITIWLTYRIGKRIGNEQVGVLAALALSLSSFHVFYSQELRPYSLAALWGVLSTYQLLSIFTTPQPTRTQYSLFALTTVAGMYTMYVYPFLMLGQLCAIWLLERKKLMHVLLSFAGAGIAFLPWLPYFLEQLSVGQQLRADLPGWAHVVGTPVLKSLPLTLGKFFYGLIPLDVSFLVLVSSCVGVVIAVYAVYVFYKSGLTDLEKYVLVVFVSTLLLAWLVSIFIPILQPKRVLFLLPLFFIGVAHALFKLKRWGRVALLAYLCLQAWGLGSYWFVPSLQREPWRELHHTLTTRYPNRSIVVFAFPDSFAPWDWYDKGSTPKLLTPYTHTLSQEELHDLLKHTTEYEYVLVFDYLRDLSDHERKIETSLSTLGLSERERIDGGSIGFVRVFSRRTTVLSYQ